MSARPRATRYGDRDVYSVSAFNGGVAGWLKRLPAVWVEGEVAELRRTAQWGLVFFSLKEPESGAVLRCAMDRERFDRLDTAPAAGDRVHALGRAELWQRRGELRFRTLRLEHVGLGLLLRRIEELRRLLAAEGLFAEERKRPLPLLPRRIGLVCGSDAAAKRDVVETASARYPPARFEIVEAAVQGAGAVGQLVAALGALDARPDVDVIVLARGGGSVEDLLPFSDERVCRAVAACATPVVSAIGHEQDTPLVDLVADRRAGTPSLAGKLIVPDYAATVAALDALSARAARALENATERARKEVVALVSRPAFASPRWFVEARRAQLAALSAELGRLRDLRLEREAGRLRNARDRLRLLGPAATLERGYAIVQDARGAVVRESSAVSEDEAVGIRLARGRLRARVEEVEP